MHKVLAALSAVTLSLALAATAVAAPPSKHAQHKYSALYKKVVKLHGKRAPGRHIVKWGFKGKRGVRPATAKEVAESIRTLRVMVMPPAAASMLRPGRPYVPPAQTATLRAPAGGALSSIRGCESGGNYSTNTGNGFSGAYQFDNQTWRAAGGSTAEAWQASPAEQDRVAAGWIASGHRGAWPNC
jgi:hypothetical protein